MCFFYQNQEVDYIIFSEVGTTLFMKCLFMLSNTQHTVTEQSGADDAMTQAMTHV